MCASLPKPSLSRTIQAAAVAEEAAAADVEADAQAAAEVAESKAGKKHIIPNSRRAENCSVLESICYIQRRC